MFFLLIHGRRARAAGRGTREAFCGHCVQKSTQDVYTIEEAAHLYFIEVWKSGTRVLARCRACGGLTPVVAREPSEGEPAHEALDAFLDAAAPDLVRIEKGNEVTALGVALTLAAFAIFSAWIIETGADSFGLPGHAGMIVHFGVGAGALLVAALAYRRFRQPVVDYAFARAIDVRLHAVRAVTRSDVAEVGTRAAALGYAALARHFALPRYAAR